MYESHFGFSGSPFQLNPDPAFYFNSKGHSRAMGYLQYGVMQGEGFIVITGEIGAGKTTLLRTLLEGLDRQKVLAAQIVSTQLESGELLQAIITAFGIPAQGSSKAHLIATLEAFLTALAAQGRHALLIVDEAQNLNEKAVEELRMLSNFQLGNHALLQSFLVGQPELRRLLESPQLEQLRQRVIASQHLGPLGPDETQAYVEHRLRHVGWTDRPVFAPGAFDHVYAWSGGVPRRINRLANRLLLAAYLENTDLITPALVEQTALELRTEIGESSYQPLPLPVRTPPSVQATAPVATEPGAAEPGVSEAVEPASPAATEPPAVPAEQEAAPSEASAIEPVQAAPQLPAAGPATTPVEPSAAPSSVTAEAAETATEPARPAESVESASDTFVEAGPSVREVAERVAAAADAFALPALPVTRRLGPTRSVERDVVLCLADSETSALAFAAVSKHLPAGADGLRLVLVNPGEAARVWPWEPMERLLPSFEVGLHLGVGEAPFERAAPRLIDGLATVIDEFRPVAVAVLGSSDALLACALAASKRGVPLVQLDAGAAPASPAAALNAALMARLAGLLLVRDDATALQGLQQQGVDAERCRAVAGRLDVDGLAALWPEVTTPYGAFMRHAMPIYLGPTWSEHAGEGTPYAVVTLTLDAARPEALRQRVEQVAALTVLPKCVWLLDDASAAVLQGLLDAEPDLAERVCLVVGDGPRSLQERDRMNSIPLLARAVNSLTDQLSILRGADAAVVEPGQVLANAASWLGLSTLSFGANESVEALNERLRALLAEQPPVDHSRQSLDLPAGAAADVAARLQDWLSNRSRG